MIASTAIVLVYLAGGVLTYGRNYASFYEVEEKYPMLKPDMAWSFPLRLFSAAFSWIGFLVGVIVYLQDKEKYFFKWSDKELWKNHRKYTKDGKTY